MASSPPARAMAQMIGTQPLNAVPFAGRHFDCGSKTGIVEATISFALERADIAEDIRAIMERPVGTQVPELQEAAC